MPAKIEYTLEKTACPFCRSSNCSPWGDELGFHAVRCSRCALIYVNPRPALSSIDAAVRTGHHGDDTEGLSVVSRRSERKVARYETLLGRIFLDRWQLGQPVSWLDIGAGYGEVVEAVTRIAPRGSRIEGLEPMGPKARDARSRGLNIVEDYLRPGHDPVDIISLVDVFSHVPDFHSFLVDVRNVLSPGGEVFVETGNLADLGQRGEFPGELGLPDHLVFAGEAQLVGYLEQAGFTIVSVERERIDGLVNLAKNLAKLALGRPVRLGIPYSSRYRQLHVRARLKA